MGDISRTAALWAAALAIVWFSGLEPTWKNITTTLSAFRDLNESRQEAESRAAIRQQAFAAEKQIIEQLKQFAAKFPTPDERKGERKRLSQQLEEAKAAESTQQKEKKRPRGESNASPELRKIDSARNELKEFAASEQLLDAVPIAERESRLTRQQTLLDAESEKLKTAYIDARKLAQGQKRHVNFELFGLKFEAPALVAPLLWCMFCLALLLYVARARNRDLQSSIEMFASLAGDPNDRHSTAYTTRLPSWTAAPAVAAYAETRTVAMDPRVPIRELWVERIFGSADEQRLFRALVGLIPILLWFSQLRVTWIGLELARHVGTNFMRGVVPLVFGAILLGTACILVWWFISESNPRSWMTRRRPWLIALGIATTLLIVAPLMAALIPGIAAKIGQPLQRSLIWLAPFPLALLAYARISPLRDAGWHGAGPPLAASRRAIIAMGVTAVLAASIVAAFPYTRSASSGRKRRKRPVARSPLEPGFYGRRHVESSRHSSTRVLQAPSGVIHYVGARGCHSGRGRQPRIEHLTKVMPPTSMTHGTLAHAEIAREVRSPAANVRNAIPAAAGRPLASANESTHRAPMSIPQTRVNLSAASWSFEEAALAILRKDSPTRKEVRHACDLLLAGIQHDRLFKQRTNNTRKRGRPSLRLYDLLAGVCIRYRQRETFEALLSIIDQSDQRLVLQTRVVKWQDVTSPWRKRWRNRQARIRWTGTSGAVVF